MAKTFELKRAEADALGYESTRYDALLDDYEPGERTSNVTRVLADLREALVPLVAEIAASSKRPDISILARRYPIDAQETFAKAGAAGIGFDFQRGRLDVTAHPFCTGLGPNDCRITTRYAITLEVTDEPGVLEQIARIFALHGVSVEQLQQSVSEGTQRATLVIGTHEATESALAETVAALAESPVVASVASVLRVEGAL